MSLMFLPKEFELLNNNSEKQLYLNKYTGDWFLLDTNFEEIIPVLKEGINLTSISSLPRVLQDLIYSLVENNLILSEGSKPSVKVSPERNQVTLIIIEALSFCNLACTYCFEDVPTKGIKMSESTADSIIRSIEKLNLASSFVFEFNGGESFSNIEMLEYLVTEVKKSKILSRYNIRYGVTTNATFINERIINFLKTNWFNVTVSLDGVQEDHDKNRVFKSGKGSHEKVMKSITKLRDSGINFNVISVITEADQIYRTYQFMKENKIKNVSFAIRRHSNRLPLTDADYTNLAQAHHAVFRDSLERIGKNEFAPVLIDYAVMIKNIVKPYDPEYMCLRTPCGAGTNMITYDTRGDIFACQDLIKEPEFKICSSSNEDPQKAINDNEIVQKLRSRKPGGNVGCEECNFQQFCQGGCYSTSYFASDKNIGKSFTKKTPHCEYYFESFNNLMQDFIENHQEILKYAYPDSL